MGSTKRRLIGLAVLHGDFAYFGRILEGITRYAEHRPAWSFVPVVFEGRSLYTLGPRKPDGLLVPVNSRAVAQALKRWTRPIVDTALILPGLGFPYVRVDNRQIAQLAFSHLYERGLRRFAFAGHRQGLYSILREAGFRDIVQRAGFELDTYHVRKRHDFDPRVPVWPADRNLLSWLDRLPKPVGMFVPSDMLGMQMAEACRQFQIQVPAEVAILGVDNAELLCGMARPKLSSIVLPTQRIGFEAARLLDRLIAGRPPANTEILLPPSGIEARQSTDVLATDDREVAAAIRFVRENVHRPLRIGDVLREVSLGRRTLERRVRRFLGRSLQDEMMRLHIARAQELLARREMSVTQVAQNSGFTSARHLAVVFRKLVGQSATAYRRAAGIGE